MPSEVHSLMMSIVFRVVLVSIILLLQWLVYAAIRRWARAYHPDRRWVMPTVSGFFALFNGAFIAILIIRPHVLEFPFWFRVAGVYPFMIWYATTFFLGLLLLVAWIVKLPFKITFWLARRFAGMRSWWSHLTSNRRFIQFDARRRQFLRRSMEGTTAVVLGGSTYGLLIGRYDFEVDRQEFALPTLDPSLDGLTITLVSDIHSSVFMTRPEMDRYVSVINEMQSDIIVVPGDFVNGLTEEVYPFAESFSNLKARYGVFGVTGNHDYYVSDPERVIRQVEECGIKLLHDEKSVLQIGGAKLTFLGIDDVGNSRKAAERITHARTGGTEGATILLCHRPYFLPQASELGVDLMLSGHTHGGQIVFANIGHLAITPAALASPYVAGTYRHGNTVMYVSRGIGTVGLPVRFNCPPEVTKIVLRKPPQA